MEQYKPYIWLDGQSFYHEIQASSFLQRYIDCYWVSYPTEVATPSRIIPDLCADLILVFSKAGDFLRVKYSGPNTEFFLSQESQTDILVGVRFYLPTLSLFIKEELVNTKNQLITAGTDLEFFSREFKEQYQLPFSELTVVTCLNQIFCQRLQNSKEEQGHALLLNVISSSFKLQEYQEVISREVISERTIQRRFREQTGLSPYEVFEVIRFQKVIKRLSQDQTAQQLDLVTDYGFYDQAHFARKIKKISGLTPTQIIAHCRKYPS